MPPGTIGRLAGRGWEALFEGNAQSLEDQRSEGVRLAVRFRVVCFLFSVFLSA